MVVLLIGLVIWSILLSLLFLLDVCVSLIPSGRKYTWFQSNKGGGFSSLDWIPSFRRVVGRLEEYGF